MVILTHSGYSGEEQHCSKFHYEEKLLEKMIRMEIKMEEMEKKIVALENTDFQIQKDFNELTSDLVSSSTIAFSAVSTISISDGKKDEIVVFNIVRINLGGGYDPASGKFTAPRSGTYMFYSSVLTGNGAEIWLYIAVNDEALVRINARATDNRHDSGSQAIIRTLNAGDIVSVRNKNEGASIYGGIYTSFC